MEIDVNFDETENKWIPLIGQFILDFVSIEESINRVNRSYLKTTLVANDLLMDNLKSQLSLFVIIFEKRYFTNAADILKLNAFKDKLLELVKIRNLIAHNGLSLVFKRNEDGEDRFFDFKISGKKNNSPSINYNELMDRVTELRQCRTHLEELMMRFYEAEMARMAEGS
jgi:hypothetical protein